MLDQDVEERPEIGVATVGGVININF